jgi:hypothetical protein
MNIGHHVFNQNISALDEKLLRKQIDLNQSVIGFCPTKFVRVDWIKQRERKGNKRQRGDKYDFGCNHGFLCQSVLLLVGQCRAIE